MQNTEKLGDWLLYFDDDFDEITIHVGETITLRPYNKWEWKEDNVDVQTAHWNVGGKDDQFWNQISSGDVNGAHYDDWDDGNNTTNTAAFHWTAYVKKDTELVTHYWAVQGRATKTGVYYLTNTKNNKTIKVNVVDGDPVNKPKTITDTADIKVNLFDYDKYYKLDPSDNTNLANNNNNKSDSTNKMGGNNHFYFLSSGSGNNNNESWNSYTNAKANPGIVKDKLDSEGYPELSVKGTSLKYLFDTSKTSWKGGANSNYPDGIIAYPDVNGMFRKDSEGYYYYNSNTNYFYYDASTGKTYLYEHTYTQTSSEDKGSLVNDKPIGFFPFHDYDATSNLYVNQNHNLNHHVGMSMDIDFYLPSNRLDENGKEIEFDFSGDDDLWVFVEWVDDKGNKQSKRLLDLGGIHQPVKGSINFTDNTGLAADKVYTLKVFYLERGGCDSNCSIRFNLPIVKDLTVAKKMNGLTPAERQKYYEDSFLYELAFKNSSQGMNIDLSDDNAVWNNQAWRTEFELYQTPDTQTNEIINKTIYHSNDGDKKGYPVSNGQITLKNGESFTVKNLPRTEIFYLAEENQLDMQQFEIPHAERMYLDAADNKHHEEEVHLHQDTAVSDNKTDWETKPYALMDTEKLVYTNTLQEKNLDVKKIWRDNKSSHNAIQFKVIAAVKTDSGDVSYSDFINTYNSDHNTEYSQDINAQWTETVTNGLTSSTTTKTENILNNTFTLEEKNNWELIFEHLPKKTQDPNGTGREIVYTVQEVATPQGYTSSVGSEIDTNKVYLDLFKFWPDENTNHSGVDSDHKAEHIKTRITRNDSQYIIAEKNTNGEYVYTGVTNNKNDATLFLLTSKEELKRSGSESYWEMKDTSQYDMFDYAARVEGVPIENEDGTASYTYELEQDSIDEDPTTTGLVMFTRPVRKVEIINTPTPTDIQIQKLGEKKVPLAGAIFQLQVKNGTEENAVYQPVANVDGYKEIGILDETGTKKELESTKPYTKTGADGEEYSSTFTSTGEVQTLKDLPDGEYKLVELKAPDGYIVSKVKEIEFTVNQQVVSCPMAAQNDMLTFTAANGKVLALFEIQNEPGAALPNTGGIGTHIFTITGLLLILAAGVLLIRRRKTVS